MREYLYFLTGWCLWRLRFCRRVRPVDARSILVVRLDHLGDGILSSPVLSNLHAAYPNARIDVLCARWNRAAFVTNPHVSRILELNPSTFRRPGEVFDRAGRFWQATAALRDSYQIVVTLRGTWLTLLAAGGFWIDRGASRVESRLRGGAVGRHETDINLSLLESAGIPTPVRIPEYAVPAECAAEVDDLFERLGVPTERALIACHVGSPVVRKRWPAPRFATLIERLAQQGAHVLLVGSVADEPFVEEVQSICHATTTSLVGRASLPQLAAVLRRCACFVGNDSAPMHLAASVGIPTVGLFFASDPERFGPRGLMTRVAKARSARDLSVDAVMDVIGDVWEPASRGEASI